MFLTDIVVNYSESSTVPPPSLTDIWLGDVNKSASCPLTELRPGRWEAWERLELDVEAPQLELVLKSAGEVTVGTLHFVWPPKGGDWTHIPRPLPLSNLERFLEVSPHQRGRFTCEAGLDIEMSWRAVNVVLEKGEHILDIARQVLSTISQQIGAEKFTWGMFDGESAAVTLRILPSVIASAAECLPEILSIVAGLDLVLFELTGDEESLLCSISCANRAISTLHASSQLRLPFFELLVEAHGRRWLETKDAIDLDAAILAARTVVDATSDDDSMLSSRLFNLGFALGMRFNLMSSDQDMSSAILAWERSLEICPQDVVLLANLTSLLLARYISGRNPSDLDRAIFLASEAVELSPEGDPWLYTHLKSVFDIQFESNERGLRLRTAPLARRRQASPTPGEKGSLNLLTQLLRLAESSRDKFRFESKLTSAMTLLVIEQEEVKPASQCPPSLPTLFNALGRFFLDRFSHGRDDSDISASITFHRNALRLASEGGECLPRYVCDLGESLACQYKSSGHVAYMDEVTLLHKKAVELTRMEVSETLHHLGCALGGQHPASNSDVARVSSGHPRRHSDGLNMNPSTSHLTSPGALGMSRPSNGLELAQVSGQGFFLSFPRSPETLNAFDASLSVLNLVESVSQAAQSYFNTIHGATDVTFNAAAVACEVGRADKAIEWLEQGRCHVWNRLNGLRAPLERLKEFDQALAASLNDVSVQLQHSGPSSTPLSERGTTQRKALHYGNLAKRWEGLLETARTIPSFENFLSIPTCSDLVQRIPHRGRVIVINVHKSRCDAVALSHGRDSPSHIPLPELTLDKAKKYSDELGAILKGHGLRMREGEKGTLARRKIGVYRTEGERTPEWTIRRILCYLWVEVVKPVLDALGISLTKKQNSSSNMMPPRIWWCPTGPLTFLPIHAAGVYGGTDGECVLDYAVSSYTPTITALLDRADRCSSRSKATSGLFLTNQPSVPGATNIPGTTREVRSIFNLAKKHGVRVCMAEGSTVSPEKCLEYMNQFSSVHLACHASQHPDDPLKSRLRFHNGDLDLATIMQADLRHADLAFLSACQTGTGDAKLPDEAVHLAAGMLAAGYCRVVATMWSIEDRSAPQVAMDFYAYLWAQGGVGSTNMRTFDGGQSANALHHAILNLKDGLGDSEHDLMSWVPYVHFGC